MYAIRPNFFAALGTRMLAGRAFDAQDDGAGLHTVIVDEVLATNAFPGEQLDQILGQRILIRLNTPEAVPVRIVGIVQHQQQQSFGDWRATVYVPAGTARTYATPQWAVRTNGDPAQFTEAIRRAVAEVDPDLPMTEIRPMMEFVSRTMAPTRFSLLLITVFGGVAGFLAAIGLYGVIATSVRQRHQEIGIRFALGASRGAILRLVLKLGFALSAAGIVLGVGAALVLTRFLGAAGMLVAVTPTDPVSYVGTVVFFVCISLVACGIPAYSATMVGPRTSR
jgi:putative ABC transport system permease protein